MYKAFPSYVLHVALKGKVKPVQSMVALLLLVLPLVNLAGIVRFSVGKDVTVLDVVSVVGLVYLILNLLVYELSIKKLPVSQAEQIVKEKSAPIQKPVIGKKEEPGAEPKQGKDFIQKVNYSEKSNKPKLTPKLSPELQEKIKQSKELDNLAKIDISKAPEAYANASDMDALIKPEYKEENEAPEREYEGEFIYDIADVNEVKQSETKDHLQEPQQMQDLPEEVKEQTVVAYQEAALDRGKGLFEKPKQRKALFDL